MDMKRRKFLWYMGILGSGWSMSANGIAQVLTDTESAEAFEPTGPIQWLGDGFLWIGALKYGGKVKFHLIRNRPSQRAELLAPVGGPKLCHQGAGAYFYALAPGRVGTVEVSGPKVLINSLADKGLAFDNCAFSIARERERLERSGFGGLTAVAISAQGASSANHAARAHVLGCRPTEAMDVSEILLFDGGDSPQSVHVNWPLARDNPVLLADPHSGDWLAYPSLSFKRRQTFKNSLPGIPVCRITRGLKLLLTWVPWGEWNESGPYRFFPHGSSLVGAMSRGWTNEGERLSGIYFPNDNRWVRRFGGQVDITSLAVSADRRYLAWSEQTKEEPRSQLYGKLRQVVRIEAI